jgi:hypothetical protein
MDTSSRELGEEEEEMGDTFRTDRAAHVKAEVDGRGVEVARKDRRDAVAEATDEDEDEDEGRCPGNGRRTPPRETRFSRVEEEEDADAEDRLSLLSRMTADRKDPGGADDAREEEEDGAEGDYAEDNAEDDARLQASAVFYFARSLL